MVLPRWSATSRCPIVDTWWQTETGGILITPLPGATPLKPGSATRPFFGVQPALVDDDGKVARGRRRAATCASPTPGRARCAPSTATTSASCRPTSPPIKGMYFTGDGCRRDEDGYYWITGRVDDVINVSGHRMGTAEVESALVAHPKVAEAAVVGYPARHQGPGHLRLRHADGRRRADRGAAQGTGRSWVRKEIGPIATPDLIQWAPGLPKTRSGKIMRRILRKIAANDFGSLGDTSTLADPAVVDDLVDNRQNRPH